MKLDEPSKLQLNEYGVHCGHLSARSIIAAAKPRPRTYSRSGGDQILISAAEAAGIELPHNWRLWSTGVPMIWYSSDQPPPGWRDNVYDPQGELIQRCARIAGWLRAAPRYRRVRCVLRRVSARGVNSPYSLIDPFLLARSWRSPGQLERWLAAVRRRATEILRPYGLSVPWEILGMVAQRGYTRIGRAATRTAALTLEKLIDGRWTDYSNFTYRDAVKYLMKHRDYAAAMLRLGPRGRTIYRSLVGSCDPECHPANYEYDHIYGKLVVLSKDQYIAGCRVRYVPSVSGDDQWLIIINDAEGIYTYGMSVEHHNTAIEAVIAALTDRAVARIRAQHDQYVRELIEAHRADINSLRRTIVDLQRTIQDREQTIRDRERTIRHFEQAIHRRSELSVPEHSEPPADPQVRRRIVVGGAKK